MSSEVFLFLVVDAVPWDVAREVWMEGALPGFPPPSRLVSTFPSLTNVALPTLVRGMRRVRPHGYEMIWFDPARGARIRTEEDMRVGGLETWPRPGLWVDAVLYTLPRGFTSTQVRWVANEAVQNAEEPWVGWISATDAVGHFRGRQALVEAFTGICEAVQGVCAERERVSGRRPRVVLASDHGLDFTIQSHLLPDDVWRMLRLAGFHERWGEADGAYIAALGAVGSGVVFTRPERAVDAAEVVAQTRGVDLAVGRVSSGAEVVAVREGGVHRARVSWQGGRYRYDPVDGDPLGYGDLGGRWIEDRECFEATAERTYPDALRRIRDAFEEIVQHPATVLFSMEAGWSFGPMSTHAGAALVGGMVATHGSLRADQSTGFAMDSAGRLPPYVRTWEPSSLLAGGLGVEDLAGAGMPWRPGGAA